MWRDGITEALLGPLCCGNERECPFRKARVQLTVKDSPRLKGCYKELVQELLFNSLSKMFCRCKTMNTKSWTNLKLKKINHKYINYWFKLFCGWKGGLDSFYCTYKLLGTSCVKMVAHMWEINSSLINYLFINNLGLFITWKVAQAQRDIKVNWNEMYKHYISLYILF